METFRGETEKAAKRERQKQRAETVVRIYTAAAMVVAVYEIGGGWWALLVACVWILLPKSWWE